METQEYTRQKLISSLIKIGHGDLDIYVNDVLPAAREDPELFGRFVVWNHRHGKVDDSKVAFPPIALRGLSKGDAHLAENAIAHMISLDPRKIIKSYDFSKSLTKRGLHIPGGNRELLQDALKDYITAMEKNRRWWVRTALRHRKALIRLYEISHKKAVPLAKEILFERKFPPGSVFEALVRLKNMSPSEASATIMKHKIPAPIAIGAVNTVKDPDIQFALIEIMTGNELINYSGALKAWGIFEIPYLKAAYDAAIERGKTDKRVNVYKASKAAESLDTKTGKKVLQIQEAREKKLKGIEGDWAILADRSASMQKSIEVARHMAAAITSQVKGKVYLLFFNTAPVLFDVTGKTYQEILGMTGHVYAGGNTSIGCGLQYLREKNILVNGIAIASDGGENTSPAFSEAYAKYNKAFGIEPTVYLFEIPGDPNRLVENCQRAGVSLECIPLGTNIDYYALPNLVNTLRTSRFALVDEIMQYKLLTIDGVLKRASRS